MAALIANGRVLAAPGGAGPWAMVGPGGRLLGVYEPFGDGQAKPAVVLADPPARGSAWARHRSLGRAGSIRDQRARDRSARSDRQPGSVG